MDKYIEFNIKPRYVPKKVEFDELMYFKYISKNSLARDLEYILCGQFK